ncbi:hypothetical protein [Kingella sp. (in: b-proteobacteria)]|nr:hypothetical protein [Kingella sp. (in: b-proteobacteria)]
MPRCRRAANAPSVTGFVKVSGCLIHIRQPENASDAVTVLPRMII